MCLNRLILLLTLRITLEYGQNKAENGYAVFIVFRPYFVARRAILRAWHKYPFSYKNYNTCVTTSIVKIAVLSQTGGGCRARSASDDAHTSRTTASCVLELHTKAKTKLTQNAIDSIICNVKKVYLKIYEKTKPLHTLLQNKREMRDYEKNYLKDLKI